MRKNFILIAIISLAFFLRIIFLGSIPSGINPDEVSQAYSAYSLLQTGADEWGASWPLLSFKSFLDQKAPLQTYLMLPSIAIFGLNAFAARLPSAIFGTFSILVIYLLANSLFNKRKLKKSKLNIGHLAAFFLAISPWHLQFSRTALEANLISFFFPLGLYAFLKGINGKKSSWFVLATFSWGLSLYAYHASKIFIPLFTLALLAIYLKKIKSFPLKTLVFPVVIALVFALPTYLSLGSTGSRGGDLLITNFSIENLAEISNTQFYSPLNRIHPIISRAANNKVIFTIDKFVENYVSYYSPTFWFTEGGRETTYSIIPGRGLIYLWQAPFVALAIFMLLKNKINRKTKIIIAWFLLAALPAAITKEGYRPNRASAFLGLFSLLTAYGVFHAYRLLPKARKTLVNILVPAIFLSALFYLNDYAFASRVKFPTTLSYGWQEAIEYIGKHQQDYDQVFVERGSQSQAFVAFFLQIPPEEFQQASKQWAKEISKNPDIKYLDQLDPYHLNNFTFKHFNWPVDIVPNTLYLSYAPHRLPSSRNTLYVIYTPDQKPILEVFDFK